MTLLRQSQTNKDPNGWITTTNNSINWFDVAAYALDTEDTYTGGYHVGWYMDLSAGERFISHPQIRGGYVIAVSMTPGKAALCSTSGGSSVLYVLNAYSGSMPNTPWIDINNDGKLDLNDEIISGKEFNNVYYTPSIIDTNKNNLNSLTFDSNEQLMMKGQKKGIYYLRLFK